MPPACMIHPATVGVVVAEQEIGRQLLAETASYAESSMCRRKTLLHYFGEEYTQENCGNCDNCLNPKKKVEAKDELCAVLEAISALKEKFKAEYIIDVLRGVNSNEIKAYRHNDLEIFGSEEQLDAKFLNAVIRQGVIGGYITRDIESYGLHRLTDKGREFLKKPVSFKIVEDTEFNDEEEVDVVKSGAGCAADPELYSILKDLRKKVAKKVGLPPYVIFQDPSLESMATTYPITIEELADISGVGMGKARRYGQEFINVIRRHVEDNEIERPEDMKVRTVPNKSKVKINIVHLIDRKIPLDEIANSMGLDFDELLEHIEGILNAGTKIDINYYVDEILDEDQQDDIYEHFKESEMGDLNTAYKELGDEYTEDEIRLVRIKFLAEMGY